MVFIEDKKYLPVKGSYYNSPSVFSRFTMSRPVINSDFNKSVKAISDELKKNKQSEDDVVFLTLLLEIVTADFIENKINSKLESALENYFIKF